MLRPHPGPFSQHGRDWTCSLSTVALVLVVVTWIRLRALGRDAWRALFP